MATAKALSTAALHFDHGNDIAIGACADHDVVLLSPAMAEPHFKGAVGAHDGSDVALWEGCPSPVDVEQLIVHLASP